MPSSSLTSEAEFTHTLGLDRESVSEARRDLLKEGATWKKRGPEVMLTEEGVQLLLEHFSVKKKPAGPVPAVGAGGLLVVVVTRQVQNPRQVLCRREGEPPDAAGIVLCVPTSREGGRWVNWFTPGLRLHARHREGAIFDYVGPRPRFRGDRMIQAPVSNP